MATTDNRDAAVFDNADTEDVDHKPNRHIAMGHGIHRCVGVALARAQPRVAVRQLLAMTDEFAVSSWSHLGSESRCASCTQQPQAEPGVSSTYLGAKKKRLVHRQRARHTQ